MPLFTRHVRLITGALLLSFLLLNLDTVEISPKEYGGVCFFAFVSWGLSTFLTDKYSHKYPHRYLTYALASNIKALAAAYFVLLLVFQTALLDNVACSKLFYVITVFFTADFFISLLKTEQETPDTDRRVDIFLTRNRETDSAEIMDEITPIRLNHEALLLRFGQKLSESALGLIRRSIPNDEGSESTDGILLVEDLALPRDSLNRHPASVCTLIIGQNDLNSVKRLNTFLRAISETLLMGGYFVFHYKPLEVELEEIRQNSSDFTYPFKYLAHFMWYRILPKTRLLSKIYFSAPFSWIDSLRGSVQRRSMARAEAWGRLFFHGMRAVDETMEGEFTYVIAQKIASPSTDTIPTYHSIVGLNKMGLNGQTIRLHKIRSMYPFSEFLQKHIYQVHGLTNTGKFKNDFRLTEYGPFIRKYWIDEIPGIYDWFRGDIKLVGMRATSPQYLSLYPKEVIRLYFQVKPGLIPPIFDEKTTGFEQIVEIEKKYLERYIQNPLKTDLIYFWYTFRDIFIRKVRSK